MAERDLHPLVLITGASGMIGARTAARLVPDYKVVGLDVKPPGEGYPDEAEFVECDLTSDASTRETAEKIRERFGPRVASVVHLAAYYDFSGEPSPLYEELTVEGTRRILREARDRLAAEQFVFSSSLLVMKDAGETEQLDEKSPVEANWDYPQSKLGAEAVIREEHGELPVVIMRIAGVYDEMGHSPPITRQIWRIREKKLESFFFPGNRSHGQSFVHLDDVAAALCAAVERRHDLDEEEVFLIGEPETLSYADLQDRIGNLLHGLEWPTFRIPAPVAKAGAWAREKLASEGEEEPFIKPWMIDLADAHYPVTIARARNKLRWEPEHRLATALPKMIDELKRDPERWYAENDLPDGDGDDAGGRAAEFW